MACAALPRCGGDLLAKRLALDELGQAEMEVVDLADLVNGNIRSGGTHPTAKVHGVMPIRRSRSAKRASPRIASQTGSSL
jgi:hypothetical protein